MSERLTRGTVAAYAAPALVLAAMALTFYVYLPKYYVDVLGVDLTALGLVVLATRLWDAVLDPAIGRLSDRTRSRWGRRRPWMALAAVPLGLSFLALAGPGGLGRALADPAALAFATFAFFLFWTAVSVPYEALGAELSMDYDERTTLLGVREGVVLAGTVVAAILPAAVGWALAPSSGPAGERTRLVVVAAAYALLALVLVGGCVAAVGERRWGERRLPHRTPFWRDLGAVAANRPFRILLAGYTVGAIGAVLPATLIFFYTEHVLGTDRGPLFLVLYLGVGFALFPAWLWVARRWEKRTAWIGAMALNTGAFALVIPLGAGDAALYAGFVALSGVGLGGTLALPPAMQADVIDYDEWARGLRREGEYTGLWSVARKLAQALGAGIAFPILDAAGYVPGGGAQPPSAVSALRLLYAGVPCLLNAAAIGIVWRYPIDRAMHQRIRREVDRRPFRGEPLAAPA